MRCPSIRQYKRRLGLALARFGWISSFLSLVAISQAVAAERVRAPLVSATVILSGGPTAKSATRQEVAPRRVSAIDTVVVCAAHLLPVVEPWLALRRSQGHQIAHVSGQKTSREIQAAIRRLAAAHALRYVVIFGDADPNMVLDTHVRARCVPTFYAKAQVNTAWGSEPHIATDNPYADLNNDHVPELAIGRICFDSKSELRQIIQKIVDYEHQPSTGLWRRRVHLTAGVGGFGPIADAAIEVATKKIITEMIPAEYAATLTHGNWRSPYCPDPRMFRETVLKRLENGGLFWVYLGHGHPDRLDRLSFGDAVVPILEADDFHRVRSVQGPPIAVMLACYTGAYDQDDDCLAERLLLMPQGPIAAIAGSRVTMPYGMAVFGTSLMDGYFQERLTCLGDVFLYAKRALDQDPSAQGSQRKLIDAAALALSPIKDNLKAERTEHQLLFQLLGDPLLVIPQPAKLAVQCRRQVTSGDTLRVTGHSPVGGKCLLELVCRRDRLTFTPPRRLSFQDDTESMANMMSVYARANDRRWTGQRVELRPGKFSLDINVPRHAEGASFVRVFVQNERDYAMGSTPIYIQPPAATDSLRTSNAQR
jgi:hypothetical protein